MMTARSGRPWKRSQKSPQTLLEEEMEKLIRLTSAAHNPELKGHLRSLEVCLFTMKRLRED